MYTFVQIHYQKNVLLLLIEYCSQQHSYSDLFYINCAASGGTYCNAAATAKCNHWKFETL